jgi:type I restriction enzyme S subunit
VELKKYKLEDLGKIVTGKTPSTFDEENYGNDYMFISPTELHNGYKIFSSQKMISQKGFNSIKSNTIDGPSVLVGCIGWDMGNVGYTEKKCATNQQINSITDFSDFCEPLYLYYWLRNKKEYLFSIASVTRTPILSKSTFSEIPISLPNIEQQKKIVNILSTIDNKIALNRRINAKLEAMAKRLYDYWFVQFDFPTEDGKPYKSSGGKMVYNGTLKHEIPAGWKVGNLYNIAEYVNGLACQNYRPQDNEKYLPVIKIKEMHDGITTETERVSENIPNKYKIYDGDILFSWSATLEVMLWCNGNGGLNQHIFKVNPKDYFSKEYVLQQLDSYIVNFQKQAESRKTTMGHITSEHINQSRIAIPPKEVIEHYTNVVAPIYEKIIATSKEIQKLTAMRDRLLPLLMNGQVEVK